MQEATRDSRTDVSRSRRFQILELAIRQSSVDVATLMTRFRNVSPATIQSDLAYLSELIPQLERTRGRINYRFDYAGTYFGNNLRDTHLLLQKEEIAHFVVSGSHDDGETPLLAPYDLVILGAGTTIYHVCRQMSTVGSNYIICTNNLALPEVAGNLSLFVLGGEFTRDIWAATGLQTEGDFDAFLKTHEHQISKAVLGTSGITKSGGFFVHNASEIGILSKFIEAAPIVIFVTGGAKLGRADTSYLTNLDDIIGKGKQVNIVTSDIGMQEKEKELKELKEKFESKSKDIRVIIVSK